jgi:P-type Cu+ transporter
LEAERRGLVTPELEAIEVLPSRGIVGHLAGQVWILGSRRLLLEQGITFSEGQEERLALLEQEGRTVLTLARSGCVVGVLAVADTIRAEVASALAEVRHLGIRRIVLLTGDNERVTTAIARAASITEVETNLLPEDKIAMVKRLQAEGRCVLMIGDGINDAPALTQANVGMAMGGIGTAVAQEAAEMALLRDDWRAVPEAIRLGRRTSRTIRQNIFFGIGFTMLVMGLAATGLIGPIIAAASQSVPDVAVALNASRLLGGGTPSRRMRSQAQ